MTRRPIHKVLVANRGEIACRILRTLRTLGIWSVAIYSEVDRQALHVALADEAHEVGPAPSADSYLNLEKVIDIAQRTGADAIHPGYGFLSENPALVCACEAADIRFIGPPAGAVDAMGLKDAAKRLMRDAGVPVIPGYEGERQEADFLARQAQELGFPVMIKARAGGGGKGMRRVERPESFIRALDSARREAQASFADDRVLIEKCIPSPRHIEFQVFGDLHGQVVHLFERDCSVQRRYQKVIEEAPAPGMTPAMRQVMGEAAVQAARAVGYVGAGTVEFMVDGSGGLHPDRFWFMEMNTRLQVEHPVTEAITGQDLVAWQIAVAEGRPLPLTQEQLVIQGHAMEARLYAEDPERGFVPATGRLQQLELDPSARVDTGVRPGDVITPWYDPLIAKLIVHGPDRATALGRLRTALDWSFVAGCRTNLRWLARLCRRPAFVAGQADTGLIATEAAALVAPQPPPPEILSAAALRFACPAPPMGRTDPWDSGGDWRLWGGVERSVALNGTEVRLLIPGEGGDMTVRVGDWEGHCTRDPTDSDQWIINGVVRTLRSHRAASEILIADADREWHLSLDAPGGRAADHQPGDDTVVASMPGRVTQVAVQAGEAVVEGQCLVVMEAMKMEHTLCASCPGVIAQLHVCPGDQVESGALLLEWQTDHREDP